MSKGNRSASRNNDNSLPMRLSHDALKEISKNEYKRKAFVITSRKAGGQIHCF